MLTMENLWKEMQTLNLNLIPNSFSAKDYLELYFNDKDLMDFNLLRIKFGKLLVDDLVEDDIINILPLYVKYVLTKNDWKYQRMYDVLNEEYDPLWNVDGTEITTYGSKTIDYEKTSHTDTTNIGQRSASASGTSSNDVYGFNSSSATPSDVSRETSSNTTAGATDSIQYGAHTDKDSHSEHTDTVRRTGNIGVTQSQQLLKSEIDVARLSLIELILNDVVMYISRFTYDD